MSEASHSNSWGGSAIRSSTYHFHWNQLDAVIAGRSAIDLVGLRLSTHEDALGFLEAYGFRPGDPGDEEELATLARNTEAFFKDVLLPFGRAKAFPRALPRDFPELLLLASTPDHELRDWACAFLRVAHAVAHARYGVDEALLSAARQQIFQRFQAHVKPGPKGSLMVSDGETHIPLLRFDIKPRKPWSSLVLKLLHKVDSVAQEVYDHLGLRFVTPTKAHALLLIQYLRGHHVFSFPNVKPSRSINTLVDLGAFRAAVEEFEAAYTNGELSYKEFTQAILRLGMGEGPGTRQNPHSGAGYHAIQFTVRTLVRMGEGASQVRASVPFEVQVMDEGAYEASLLGEAAHEAYRHRQREAVCRRVMPWAAPMEEAGEDRGPEGLPPPPTEGLDGGMVL